jgi:Protein of unknown function (DUF4199)
MENSKPSSSSVTVKWALFYLVSSIIITYGIQFLSLDPNSPVKYLSYLPFIAFLLLAQKEYRDKLSGFLTFGEGFLTGFLYSVFGAIMVAIFVYIYFGILNPHALDVAMESQRQALVDKGNLSSEQIDQSLEIAKKYGAIIGAVGTLFVVPIFGAIVALIGAAIFKKERSVADIENEANSFTEPTV